MATRSGLRRHHVCVSLTRQLATEFKERDLGVGKEASGIMPETSHFVCAVSGAGKNKKGDGRGVTRQERVDV